jgi:hypothetical protein
VGDLLARTSIGGGSETYDKLLRRFIRKSTDVLLQSAKESEEPAETWLEGQHLLLQTSLLIIGNLNVSGEVLDSLEAQLDENLEEFEHLKETSIEFPRSVTQRFFTHLLVYNLFVSQANREEYRPSAGQNSLLRHLYTYDELVDRETYRRIRSRTQRMLDQLESTEFDESKFRRIYASLAAGSVTPKTMRDDIVGICRAMIGESDSDFQQLQRAVSEEIASNYSISRRLKRRLRKLDASDDDVANAAIAHVLQQ